LDLQNFSKKNNADIINGQEGDGEVSSPMKAKNDKTETVPAQKNDKSTKIVES